MKAKQSLSSSIRGWFPESPNGLNFSIAPNFGSKRTLKDKIYSPVPVQVISSNIVTLLLVGTICPVIILFSKSFLAFQASLGNFVVMVIIAGVAIGTVVGVLPVYKMLDKLTKGRKTLRQAVKNNFYLFSLCFTHYRRTFVSIFGY